MNQNKDLLQFADLEAWIQSYTEKKRLPKNKILCSVCQETETAMLPGSNLKQVDRNFGGDIRKMLTSFACRTCRHANQPVKVTKSRTAKGSSKKEDSTTIHDLPIIDFKKAPVFLDLNVPEHVAQVTTGHCHRPDLFLNAKRSCDLCALFEHCQASMKKRSRNYKAPQRLQAA